jgi:hypothetical protein
MTETKNSSRITVELDGESLAAFELAVIELMLAALHAPNNCNWQEPVRDACKLLKELHLARNEHLNKCLT